MRSQHNFTGTVVAALKVNVMGEKGDHDTLRQLREEVEDSLEDLDYTAVTDLAEAVNAGLGSEEYSGLVAWLAAQLGESLQDTEQGSPAWLMEVSELLRELGCPHPQLTSGPVEERLATASARLLLLEFLTAELLAARMVAAVPPPGPPSPPEAAPLQALLVALGLPRPPPGTSPAQIWEKVAGRVREVQPAPAPALLQSKLTHTQWEEVERLAAVLETNYSLRREMLLARLDATVQSFTWSDRVEGAGREGEVGDMLRSRRTRLQDIPAVGPADILAAREDAAIVEKVSSSRARQNTR